MEVRPNSTVDNSPPHLRHTASTPSKKPASPPTTVDTTSVCQRLQKELMSLMMCGRDLGVSAFPEGESIFTWVGTIQGGKGTMYEGLSYKLSLRFPVDYPFKAPQVKFETLCFHPNVDQFGNICLDILQDNWSSAYDCRTILLSIQSLLGGMLVIPSYLNFVFTSVLAFLLHDCMQNQTLIVLSTAVPQNCGITRKSTKRWSTSNITLENYLRADPPSSLAENI
ncbi:hypothetical protein K2173_020375 [Erythroxylum novogranatense]|uniref:UBC core domain-containing protein n=1 Tax=Erythroxylum novogranatense TaxID=1862640 RepID=A0AAV8TI63_9ROSI|nr:hypothetical protein K2173_020375 [Erythroxylum novogranatense]